MSLEIYYTPRAKQTLNAVYQFVYSKFGEVVAGKFILKAERTIALIAEQPLIFKSSTIDESVRVARITKQSSLFYKVNTSSIHLLFFWDNRQEPIIF